MEDIKYMQNFQSYIRLSLLLDKGLEKCREIFFYRYKNWTGESWQNSREFSRKLCTIYSRQLYNRFTKSQKEKLDSGHVNQWDMTILSSLLINIEPPSSLSSQEFEKIQRENKNIKKLMQVRSKHVHLTKKSLSQFEFTPLWKKGYGALEELGVHTEDMDKILNCPNIYSLEPKTGPLSLNEEEAHEKFGELRAEGNEAAKLKNYKKAIHFYTTALILPGLDNLNKGLLYSNRSSARLLALQEEDQEGTLAAADARKAIESRPLWFKGYFRLGKVFQRQREWLLAVENFNQSLALSPSQCHVKRARDECREELKLENDLAACATTQPDLDEFEERNGSIHVEAEELTKVVEDMCQDKDPEVAAVGWVCLGDRYKNGIDVPQNLKMAAELYDKAVSVGDPNGMFNLGVMYQDGQGVEKDLEKAVKYFEKASNLPRDKPGSVGICRLIGISNSQFYLGQCYFNGKGKPKDYSRALNWFEKAHKNGSEAACHSLGHFYAEGLGVAQNTKKAIEYWKLSAQKDWAQSMDSLCRLYIKLGEPDEAEDWLYEALDMENANTLMDQINLEKSIEKLRHNDDIKDEEKEENNFQNVSPSPSPPTYERRQAQIFFEFQKHEKLIKQMAHNGDEYAHRIHSSVMYCAEAMSALNLYQDSVTVVSKRAKMDEIIYLYSLCIQSCHLFALLTSPIIQMMEPGIDKIIALGNTTKFWNKESRDLDLAARICHVIILQIKRENLEKTLEFVEESRRKYLKDKFLWRMNSHLLGLIGRWDEGLKLIDEGLIEFPNDYDFLLTKAETLKLASVGDDIEQEEMVKEAYFKFLEMAPKCHEKVPEAFYNIAFYSYNFNEELQQCQLYFEEGMKAEQFILPCFIPIEDCQAKVFLENLFKITQQINQNDEDE